MDHVFELTSKVSREKPHFTRATSTSDCESNSHALVKYGDEPVTLWSLSEEEFGGVKMVMSREVGSIRAASGSRDKSVRLPDVETEAFVDNALCAHTHEVLSVAMDGPCSVRVRDVETRAEVGWRNDVTLESRVNGVAMGAEG